MAKRNKVEVPKINNLVAKHMETFNKPKTFVDRKKRQSKGYTKHKGRIDAL